MYEMVSDMHGHHTTINERVDTIEQKLVALQVSIFFSAFMLTYSPANIMVLAQ